MTFSIPIIQKILKNKPPNTPYTEQIVKEQIYICLSCLNSWEEAGFEIKKEEDKWIVFCNKCNNIVWSEKSIENGNQKEEKEYSDYEKDILDLLE